jgi:hypothetical protein
LKNPESKAVRQRAGADEEILAGMPKLPAAVQLTRYAVLIIQNVQFI